MTVLSRQAIAERLRSSEPLVEGMPDAVSQLQPQGVDLTLATLARLSTGGQIGPTNEERVLSEQTPVEFDAGGWAYLSPGTYMCRFNETVHLPLDLMGFGRTRSSLLRCGVSLHTAVWDAGYSGRSESLLVVYNPKGVRLARNARIMQLVLLKLDRATSEGYAGRFLRENM